MKRSNLTVLLFAATLGLGSCNDIQELNLNYGERTYINDYKSLVEAVNNLSATLKERFYALEELLKVGFADVKVAIDANTGAIKVLEVSTKDGLGTLNTSIFNGFNSVCTQIDTSGKTIVAAIDSNGNLLSLQIDNTGKLINAQLITSTADLVNIMKLNNATLTEKLTLIKAAMDNGFANITTANELIKDAINLLTTEVQKGNISQDAKLAQLIDAITDLKTQTATNTSELASIIEKTAYSAGIDIPEDFPAKVNMSKSAYETMQAEKKLNGSSETENVLLNKLELQATAPVTDQRVWQTYPDGNATGHSCFQVSKTAQADPEISAQLATDPSGRQYYEVFKTQQWIEYKFTLSSSCTWPYCVLIETKDARGTTQDWQYSQTAGGEWNNIRVYYIYTDADTNNTTICTKPSANAWCSSSYIPEP